MIGHMRYEAYHIATTKFLMFDGNQLYNMTKQAMDTYNLHFQLLFSKQPNEIFFINFHLHLFQRHEYLPSRIR